MGRRFQAPDSQQLEILSSVLGSNAKIFETLPGNFINLARLAFEN